ncbi:hypothetical protein JCM5353_007228 [Sporobolomyces roseus]
MPSTHYDERARAPLHLTPKRSREYEESVQLSLGRRRTTSRGVSRTCKGDAGPEFMPLSLTSYEPGKRTRHRREDSNSESSPSGSEDSGPSSSASDTTDGEDERPRPPPAQTRPPSGSNRTIILLIAGIVVVLLLGLGVWYYRSKLSTLSSSEPSTPSSDTVKEVSTTVTPNPTAAASASPKSTSSSSQASKTSSDDPEKAKDNPNAESPSYRDKAEAAEAAVADKDTASSDSSTPTPTPSSSSDDSSSNGAPSEWSMITLSGTFASNAAATGKAATVDDAKANADMAKLKLEPNQDLLENRKGKIWVGDTTFYAAGKGGYGSCGTKLYDGQDIFFAAMSVYELMGSASPAPYCYSCISLQSTKDPSKTIIAVVSDSCPACTLGHVDLEQKAFFALGATVEDGILTVGWSFIDCPDGWTKEDMETISDSVYEEVES